jgi:hypothetical protein
MPVHTSVVFQCQHLVIVLTYGGLDTCFCTHALSQHSNKAALVCLFACLPCPRATTCAAGYTCSLPCHVPMVTWAGLFVHLLSPWVVMAFPPQAYLCAYSGCPRVDRWWLGHVTLHACYVPVQPHSGLTMVCSVCHVLVLPHSSLGTLFCNHAVYQGCQHTCLLFLSDDTWQRGHAYLSAFRIPVMPHWLEYTYSHNCHVLVSSLGDPRVLVCTPAVYLVFQVCLYSCLSLVLLCGNLGMMLLYPSERSQLCPLGVWPGLFPCVRCTSTTTWQPGYSCSPFYHVPVMLFGDLGTPIYTFVTVAT